MPLSSLIVALVHAHAGGDAAAAAAAATTSDRHGEPATDRAGRVMVTCGTSRPRPSFPSPVRRRPTHSNHASPRPSTSPSPSAHISPRTLTTSPRPPRTPSVTTTPPPPQPQRPSPGPSTPTSTLPTTTTTAAASTAHAIRSASEQPLASEVMALEHAADEQMRRVSRACTPPRHRAAAALPRVASPAAAGWQHTTSRPPPHAALPSARAGSTHAVATAAPRGVAGGRGSPVISRDGSGGLVGG